jgi:hypothetical protein
MKKEGGGRRSCRMNNTGRRSRMNKEGGEAAK